MRGVDQSVANVFGEIVRDLRNRLELSQEELADRSGLHRNAIGLIERGERTPNIETLLAIADGLESRPSLLIARLEKRLSR